MAPRERLTAVVAGVGARERLAAALLAVVAAVLTYAVAVTVFAYHSSNHDEAVYLQQASLLLSGQFEMYAGDLAGAVRPWFFVEDGGRLYPKYAPYPAALYAVAMALGEPRLALAGVAAANVALVYAIGAAALDRRVGVLAAAIFAASPMALVTTSVFLPYAPTTTLNLLFAALYLRGVRRGSAAAAAGAGLAVGAAFFARPFTAVLFAAPFVGHALVETGRALAAEGLGGLPGLVRRNGLTAALGLAFVALTLAYNARVTGSPLVFPYEAFAPLDGPGFGYREILGYGVEYTPGLALVSNGYALWYLATRWFTAGLLGTGLALAGVGLLSRRWWRRRGAAGTEFDTVAFGTLAGLLVTVPLGNVAFWGTHNLLGTPSDPTDGLVSQFGPFYHFDLLVPLSVFAAVAVLAGGRWLRRRAARRSATLSRGVLAVVLVVGLLGAGAANAALVTDPLERNAAYADKYETAYEPFEPSPPDEAVVFLPGPYGDWLNHPFQYLRNDPGLDGETVYALDRGPEGDFAVIDAYPDREHYRYTYRGEWSPAADRHVVPKLEPLSVREGERLTATATAGTSPRTERARVRLSVDGTTAERDQAYAVDSPGEAVTAEVELTGEGARLAGADGEPVPVAGATTVVLTVTLVEPGGGTFTYRLAAAVRADGDRLEAVWPPERTACPLVTDCGREGTYLPDSPEEHRGWVTFETRLEGGG